jgi:protein SCO1
MLCMRKEERPVKSGKWLTLILIGMLAVLAGCSAGDRPAEETQTGQSAASDNDVSDLNWQVPSFTYTNQNNETVGLEDLKGKVWLADFIFTRCPNVCPPMTANMSKVQEALKQAGVKAEIVSFTVDPEHDQPEQLREFAEKHHADLNSWHFLTGYSLEEIQKLTREAFKGSISQQEGPSPDVPLLVNHPTQFYLIDQNGKVVKFYDGLKPDAGQIIQDIKNLQK